MTLRTYRSHKRVKAAQILRVETLPNGTGVLHIEGDKIPVDNAYLEKHKPQVGGYFVQYEDGYRSWSPESAFVDGYQEERE